MDTNLLSIGKACSILQVMPDRIKAAAAALGVDPSLTVDGVVYYSVGDVGKITAFLRQQHDGQGMTQRLQIY